MSRAAIAREATSKIVKMLAEKDVKITQRGSKAYVQCDKRTGRPVLVNIPYIPDDASDELMSAVQGFIDHEVAHILFTDYAALKKVGNKKTTNFLAELIENSLVERKISKLFAGSGLNLRNVGQFLITEYTDKQLKEHPENTDALLLEPAIRAWAGQQLYQDYMKDKWHLIQPIVDALGDAVKEVAKVQTTGDSVALASKFVSLLQAADDEQQQQNADGPDGQPGKSKGGEKGDKGSKSKSKDKGKSDDEDDNSGGDGGSGKQGDEKSEGKGSSKGKPKKEEKEAEDESGSKGGGASEKEKSEEEGDEEDSGSGDGDDESDGEDESDEGDESDDEGEGGSEDGDGDSDDGDGDSEGGDGEGDEDEAEQSSPNKSNGSTTPGTGAIVAGLEDKFSKNDFDGALSQVISAIAGKEISESDYKVYTTEFDRIEAPVISPYADDYLRQMQDRVDHMVGPLQKDLERAIAAKSAVSWSPGHRSGRLHAAQLSRLVSFQDTRVFRRKEIRTSKDVAVSLLIDCSGSMGGSKIHTAAQTAYALASVLDRMNIAFEVLGFTTGNMMKTDSSMTGVTYSRTNTLYIPVLKAFKDRFTPDNKRRLGQLPHSNNMVVNIDGESVQIAARRLAQRKETRKILMVLSDGMPAGSGSRTELNGHLKKVVKETEASGIDVLGLGIQSEAVQYFYKKSMVITDVNELPTVVIGNIKRLLMK